MNMTDIKGKRFDERECDKKERKKERKKENY